MKKSEIVMKGECEFRDNQLWEEVLRMGTKVQTLNERTKRQTTQIGELRKRIKLTEEKYGRKLQT